MTEFDGPEEVEVESRESDQEGSDDGDGPSTSADGSGTESVADDHVPLDGHGQPNLSTVTAMMSQTV